MRTARRLDLSTAPVGRRGLVIDLFAGGGGASVGIEAALGRPVHIALNHDPIAMAVHAANHPGTAHFTKDIWKAAPLDVTRGQPVDQLWASPDCKHFSRAKGRKPRNKKIRVLACSVTRWAREVRPRIIYLENVEEFLTWGPLKDGEPDPKRKGKSFRSWIAKLRRYGYAVEWRLLNAADFGAPTRRKRLFVIARRDGETIAWPTPTHGPGRTPYRTAAECIDWSLPCRSIFGRKKPLVDKTMWRIAQGVLRRVLRNPQPFVMQVNHGKWQRRDSSLDEPLSTVTASERGHALAVPVLARYNGQGHSVDAGAPLATITTKDRFGLAVPVLARFNGGDRGHRRGQNVDEPLSTLDTSNRFGLVVPILQQSGYGERKGQAARTLDLWAPLGTQVDGQKHALVSVFLSKAFGHPGRKSGGGVVIGDDVTRPISTIAAERQHHGLAGVELAPAPSNDNRVDDVRALLRRYCSNDNGGLTEREALGIVTLDGVDWQIVDILFRMLEPHELLAAQFGRFAAAYDLSAAKTKKDKVRLVGNSVCPELAEAIILVNNRRRKARGTRVAEAA